MGAVAGRGRASAPGMTQRPAAPGGPASSRGAPSRHANVADSSATTARARGIASSISTRRFSHTRRGVGKWTRSSWPRRTRWRRRTAEKEEHTYAHARWRSAEAFNSASRTDWLAIPRFKPVRSMFSCY
ncbi:unnamed protein product [Triticum turgidum subsp. durum]|uniref:Uncharacterized protein n=1 Tax=Triticum turgidum subsp. durum TaxID=4567 RepID=A0A9R0Z160_TRITD|nr:unnamed protein product [Triticum turgidum subsp. durum]